MNKFLSFTVVTTLLTLVMQFPSHAQKIKSDYVGPTVIFGNGNSAIGAQAKFGVAESISVRPVLGFLNNGTLLGVAATYDFDVPAQSARVKFEPFAGLGVSVGSGNSTVYAQLGTDVGVSENIIVTGDIKIPFSGGGSLFGIGAGFKF
jgi:hypothetical protein